MYIIPVLVQTQIKSFTSWDNNILGLIQTIHHPIWMLKFLRMPIFGDAETKGEKTHHLTQRLGTAQRHRWTRTSLHPDRPDAFDPRLDFVCWTAGQTAQTHCVLTTPSETQAAWVQTKSCIHLASVLDIHMAIGASCLSIHGWITFYYSYVIAWT